MGFLLALTVALSTPCAAEDSNNCYWDATTRGNGQGHSFFVVNGLLIRDDGVIKLVEYVSVGEE